MNANGYDAVSQHKSSDATLNDTMAEKTVAPKDGVSMTHGDMNRFEE